MIKPIKVIFCLLFLFLIVPSPVWAASLSLEPDKVQIKKGERFNLKITLQNPEKAKTLGTDLILHYDPKILKAVGVKESKLYPYFLPGEEKRIKENKIIFSGVAEYGQPVDGEGELGTIIFEAVQAGETKVYLKWEEGRTNDTNIVSYEGDKDLLTQAPNQILLKVEELSFWDKVWQFLQRFLRLRGQERILD